jgi:hypothetical protein
LDIVRSQGARQATCRPKIPILLLPREQVLPVGQGFGCEEFEQRTSQAYEVSDAML